MSQNTQDAIDAGMGLAKLGNHKIEGIPHISMHKDVRLESKQGLMPTPLSVSQSVACTSPESFLFNYEKYKGESSQVYANDRSRVVTAIFDGSLKDKPQWGRNTATLEFDESPEWKRFKYKSGEVMTGLEFSYFLEDNIKYISSQEGGGLNCQDIMSMAASVKVKVKGEIEIDESVKSGLRKLHIQDDTTVKGTVGGKTIDFPEVLEVELRIYRNVETYKFQARLRHRVEGNKLVFWYDITDYEMIEESAFEEVIEGISLDIKDGIIRGSISY